MRLERDQDRYKGEDKESKDSVIRLVDNHLGDLEDDGLGALTGGGDVDVHVAVLVLGLHGRTVPLRQKITSATKTKRCQKCKRELQNATA